MWFSAGFAALCGVGAYLLRGWALLCVAAVLGGMLFLTLCIARPPIRMGMAAFLLGAIAGVIWFYTYDTVVIQPAKALDGTKQEIVLRADSFSWDTERGSAVDGSAVLNGRSYKVRLYFQETAAVLPGDQITAQVRFRFTDKGGENANLSPGKWDPAAGISDWSSVRCARKQGTSGSAGLFAAEKSFIYRGYPSGVGVGFCKGAAAKRPFRSG